MATAASVFSSPGVGGLGCPSSTAHFSPVICRSDELLSCAKTAVKIAKKQNQGITTLPNNGGGHHSSSSWWNVNLSDLHLYPLDGPQPLDDVLEDGLSLLRTMEGELKQLEGLVRRRGTTNDPTEEISMSVNRLQTDTKELLELIQTLVPPTLQRSRGQRHRHWQLIQQWFQSVAQQQGVRLKEILKVRGQVLAEQAQRRKLFQASPSPTKKSSSRTKSASGGRQIASGNAATARSAYDNPLFTMPSPTPPRRPPVSAPAVPSAAAAASAQNGGASTDTTNRSGAGSSRPAAAPNGTGGYSYYGAGTSGGYYGGGAAGGMGGGGGYGSSSSYGASGGLANTGMRQRRHVASTATSQDSQQQTQQEQQQLLVRQQERQTQQRLQEARQAERSLAELGTLFSKMSSLISQQSEVIDNIEDDVEAAHCDVSAGHAEIQTLYTIKKGNRGLILKVFGLLIFFIIFMRFYRN